MVVQQENSSWKIHPVFVKEDQLTVQVSKAPSPYFSHQTLSHQYVCIMMRLVRKCAHDKHAYSCDAARYYYINIIKQSWKQAIKEINLIK